MASALSNHKVVMPHSNPFIEITKFLNTRVSRIRNPNQVNCMRIKILFLLLSILSLTAVYAQEVDAPDYKLIRTQIQNVKGPNYYPTLMRRYMANDTTLSMEQYRALYYGFTLQEDFVPYQTEKKQLFDIRKSLNKSKGSPKLCPEAIQVSQTVLDDNPFDLLAISTISFAYLQLKDTVSYQLWNAKQNALLDAIISSGDGESKESAIHVIDIEHEYEVLNRLGLKVEKDSLCNNQVEYLKVKDNAEDIPGLFFNFGACRSVYKKRYEE